MMTDGEKTLVRQKKFRSVILKIAKTALPILFWILVWQGLAMLVNHEYFFPDVFVTFKTLFNLIVTKTFWSSALLTLCRVISGLLIGTFLGVILAIASNESMWLRSLLSPVISVIKATPVATFIILLWIMMSGNALSILIAVLMVMPIIWQNLLDSFASIDKDLLEVASVFQFSYVKRLKLIILPSLLKFLVPALVTATGLAWKSEIAAEIIAYTKNSIGQQINDAKYYLETPLVFAWTIVIITFSICLERLMKYLLGRWNI